LTYNNKEAADIAKTDSDKNQCNKLLNSEVFYTDYNEYTKADPK